ncbi:hypothetical protein BDC45DRAFT_296687 [Circinella umbellata]|nr:hypothetical protein BDC45DRAFT_296687 [Circinella umbellata]
MKNGEIVVDETTLRATSKLVQETEQETEEEMEEELDKQVVDEGSFIRMQRGSNPQLSKRWTFEETELFYELLKELGLNFTAISARIPGRTREQIRKKYFKEYKSYPLKIDKLLQN